MANAHPGTTPGIDISAHKFPCMEAKIIVPTHNYPGGWCECVCVLLCVCLLCVL